MEDFSSKLRKLFKPKPKVFRGKGNVLGRAEEVLCWTRYCRLGVLSCSSTMLNAVQLCCS